MKTKQLKLKVVYMARRKNAVKHVLTENCNIKWFNKIDDVIQDELISKLIKFNHYDLYVFSSKNELITKLN